MRVATVPVGYADGYPRLLSNKGRMRVGGAFAPVGGRVCMDQLMLDVTGLPVKEGDEVVAVSYTHLAVRLLCGRPCVPV